MHKVFISYHHANDQRYKEKLVKLGAKCSIFEDLSVETGDIPDEWTDEQIRRKIRDKYLGESTVTIVLVGKGTRHRKHVDWEIYSSMYDGSVNKRSGIVVVNLPGTSYHPIAPHGDEEKKLYPEIPTWILAKGRAEYERRFPYMPDRIIDNLMKTDVKISVVPWEKMTVPKNVRFLIEAAFRSRHDCKYDLSSPMRRANS